MICIRCQHDSKFPDRTGKRCPACNGEFAFEPRIGDKFTDQGFANAINRVSSSGSVKFTKRNLFYEAERLDKRSRGSWGASFGLLASGIGFIGVGLGGPPAMVFIGAVLLGVMTLKLPFHSRRHVKLAEGEFEMAYARWQKVYGVPPDLITAKPMHGATTEPSSQGLANDLREEIEQYSFDRAVITDTRETADLLLMNDFHFENNCAVLSIDGHPANAFDTVRAMLRNNPKIDVFALHDCTPRGCQLAWKLRRDPAWFRDSGTVYDVALRPAQAGRMKTSWLPAEPQVAEHPGLTEKEREFLGNHAIELAAIRPEQLVKRLFRAMNLLTDGGAMSARGARSGDGTVVWATDASASDGGGDSFG